MSEAREPLSRICIVGSGQVGVLAAIGLKRALPQCEIIVIGTQGAAQDFADRASSALPFTNKLHDRLGIAEEAIIGGAGGSHRLVTRYIGWGEEGQYGAFSHGESADPARFSVFEKDWGRGPRNASGEKPAGSLAEVLADAGRFATPPHDRQTPLSHIDYALRWHPPAYRALLVEQARRLGVTYSDGEILAVSASRDGEVSSIEVAGRDAVAADLFLDCTGSVRRITGALKGFQWTDWEDFLPGGTLLLASPGSGMIALEDRISLLEAGWLGEFAGLGGFQTVLRTPPGADEGASAAALGSGPAQSVELESGRLAQPWVGNVIALGDSAAQFEPLANLNLDLAHRMLDLLLEMLPGREIEPLERAEFNRRAGLMMDGVRDTLALHFAAPRARAIFGKTQASEAVTKSIDQFTRRGRLPFVEELPVSAQERLSLMRSLGFPEGTPPQLMATDERMISASRQAFEEQARAALQFAPPYGQWLQAQQRATAPPMR